MAPDKEQHAQSGPAAAANAAAVAPFGMGSVRSVPVKVIVCSLSRTGTHSMQAALRILGMPAFHAQVLFDHQTETLDDWTRALAAKYVNGRVRDDSSTSPELSRLRFDEKLGEFMAVCDLPGSLFAVELAQLYPDAKVVVLNRDPDSWFRSCRAAWPFRFSSFGFTLFGWMLYWSKTVQAMHRYLRVLQRDVWGFEWPDADAEHKAKDAFQRYYNDCRDRIPADRRLEFSVQDGWGPLCQFLEVEIPKVRPPGSDQLVEIPFPRKNDIAAIQKYQNNIMSNLIVAGVYGWTGRIALVAAVAQGFYLSSGYWLPPVCALQTAIGRYL